MTNGKIIDLIDSNYPFTVESVEEAPRQFVAETFVIKANNGEKYFVKVTNKPSFVSEIVLGLPALHELHNLGVDFINYPITTKTNAYYIKELSDLVVLYNYIPASQTYDYDLQTFGELTAKIHQISSKVKSPVPFETFIYKYTEIMERALSFQMSSKKLNELITLHSDMLHNHYIIFEKICKKQQEINHEGKFVVTNGDAPGNVLAKSRTELFITDWDDLRFANQERDLWFLDHEADFMQGYRKVFPEFKINLLNKYFCVLNYFFNSCAQYMNEIETGVDAITNIESAYSDKHLAGLSGFLNLKDSWISRYLVGIDDFVGKA